MVKIISLYIIIIYDFTSIFYVIALITFIKLILILHKYNPSKYKYMLFLNGDKVKKLSKPAKYAKKFKI